MPELAGFELVRELGHGSGGRVWLARDATLAREVAIKVLAPELVLVPEAVERFKREARALAGIDHESVVRVHSVGEDALGRHYCVMGLVPGVSLDEVLAREPISIDRATRLVLQVARGLGRAHARGILHRDVKPQNIVVEGERAVLVDFGLARLEGEARITGAVELLGTRGYIAPEVAAGGARNASAASDVYSLGVVLFEALTLRLPDEEGGTSPGRVRGSVPPKLDAIVQVALAAAPSQRYVDAESLARDLEAYLEGREVSARPEHRIVWLARRVRGRTAALAAFALLVGGLLVSLHDRSEREAAARASARDGEARLSSALRDERFREARALADELDRSDPSTQARARVAATARARTAQALEAAERGLRSGELGSAMEHVAEALECAPLDSRALALRERVRALSSSVRVRFATDPDGALVSLRVGTRWEELGSAPAVALLRPGTAIVRVSAAGRHPVQLPVVVATRSLAGTTAESLIEILLPRLPEADAGRADMVYVPAGEAILGGPALGADPREPTRVRGPAFWIDRREVTAGQLGELAAKQGYARRELWSEAGWHWLQENRIAGPGYPAKQPPEEAASGVSRFEAEAFARSRGRRLPTAEEWERAARGTDGRSYPWGDDDRDAVLDPPGSPRAPGAVVEDESPYGVLDLAGNVAEWTQSLFRDFGSDDPSRAIVKGGGVHFPRALGLARAGARATLDPADRDHGVGFRCAWSGQ